MPQRHCPTCDTPFNGNPAFCKSCGRKLDDIPPAPPPRWPPWTPFALAAAVLFLAVLCGAFGFRAMGADGQAPAATTAPPTEAAVAPTEAAPTITAATTEAAPTITAASAIPATTAPAAATAAPATPTPRVVESQTATPTSPAPTAPAPAPGPTRVVQGVLPAFAYTQRIATVNGVSVTRMRAEPDESSERREQLTNGDELELLREDVAGWYEVRVLRSAAGTSSGETGWIERWLVDGEPAPPTPAPSPTPSAKLRVRLLNYDDDPACISMRITGIRAAGWALSVDGLAIRGTFDGASNARVCGLGSNQEVTVSVLYPGGGIVPGGRGVRAKGSAILLGEWR